MKRLDHEPPAVVRNAGWRYHHLGIPTAIARPGERYIPAFKLYVTGFETSPYGVEWMRYDGDSPVPEIIRTVPHVAFEVDDLDAALVGKEVIFPACAPSSGVRSAMILDDGAPIELIEFR